MLYLYYTLGGRSTQPASGGRGSAVLLGRLKRAASLQPARVVPSRDQRGHACFHGEASDETALRQISVISGVQPGAAGVVAGLSALTSLCNVTAALIAYISP
jgi:hypothetical protein